MAVAVTVVLLALLLLVSLDEEEDTSTITDDDCSHSMSFFSVFVGDIDIKEDFVAVFGTRLFDAVFSDSGLILSLLWFVFVMVSGNVLGS